MTGKRKELMAVARARELVEQNRRLALELAESREILRAIRRGEVDALVSSEADALYAIQLAALAIDRAETYLDSLALLLKQLCLAGGWLYGEAWAASSDRKRLRRTGAWYGGCTDAVRLHECIARLLFDEDAETALAQALEAGTAQWSHAERLRPGARATAITQCGFQTGVALPIVVAGQVTAVVWLWKKERQAAESASIQREEEIIAEVGPLVQRKRDEEILRFTVNELEAAVRERSREVVRLTHEQALHARSAHEPAREDAARHVEPGPAWLSDAAVLLPVLDSMSEGVVVADRDGRVVQCNPAARKILGDDPPGEISLDLWPDIYGLYHADRVTRLEYEDLPLVAAMHGEPVYRMEIFVRNAACPEGRTLEMSASPIAAGDSAPRGAVAVFEDMTQRRRISDKRLQKVIAQRDALLREVHHRIKNNLAAVTELLRHHTRDDPSLQSLVKRVEPQLRAIAAVHGLKAGTDGSVHLGPLIKSVTDNTTSLYGAEVRLAIAERLRALQLREEESVPLALVLSELLVNARKHGTDEPLDVRAELDGDSVMIAVSNKVAPGAVPPDDGQRDGKGISLVRALLPHDRATLEFDASPERVSAVVRLAPEVFGNDFVAAVEDAKW
jgi:two-component sensor histidine kinase/PAS domain-containing protein